ncbi:MAG: hypothetical protein VXY53_03710 [Candidatus Thermoplasmatota archaeon]|nr:hypothetical protein [Candidatus Thermoplasmatota archaeon]
MVDESTTKSIAYAVFFISFLVMIYYITKQAKENRRAVINDTAPRIAGSDTLIGGAKNPQQFDEPDDDALEQMAELLGEDDD